MSKLFLLFPIMFALACNGVDDEVDTTSGETDTSFEELPTEDENLMTLEEALSLQDDVKPSAKKFDITCRPTLGTCKCAGCAENVSVGECLIEADCTQLNHGFACGCTNTHTGLPEVCDPGVWNGLGCD